MSLPDPITRKETFLAAAAGESVTTPEPLTREEEYLAAIAEGGGGGSSLPAVTSDDNGKVLGVVSGGWAATEQDFVVTFIYDGVSGEWSADKTFFAIKDAYDAKKRVYGAVEGSDVTNDPGLTNFRLFIPLAGIYGSVPLFTGAFHGESETVFIELSIGFSTATARIESVPVPGDASMDTPALRHLVASPGGILSWVEIAPIQPASAVMDSSDTYSLNDYALLAFQSFLTSAVSNPGVFTAVSQSADFSKSTGFEELLWGIATGRNQSLQLQTGTESLILRPVTVSEFASTGLTAATFHASGLFEITSGVNAYVDLSMCARLGGVDIMGFAMPTTMSQAPTLSGSYTSGTNTLNITGGA